MKARTKTILLLALPFLVFAGYYGPRRIAWEMAGRKSWSTQRKLESQWTGSSFQIAANTPEQTIRETIRIRLQKMEAERPSMDSPQASALADALTGMFL